MTNRIIAGLFTLILGIAFESGCATKKYVRNRIAERVQPLENRTSELEETSRRNTSQISQLNSQLSDVTNKVGKAQDTADRAAASAEQANSRITGIESNVEDIRNNLDKYAVQNTTMVFFRPGSVSLTNEAMAQLDQLAGQITDWNGVVLEITGYGDTVRSSRYNDSLAQSRADSVERYLADRHNIPIMRMYALGFGAPRPMTEKVSSISGGGISSGGQVRRRVDVRMLVNAAMRNQNRSRPSVKATSGASH
jgi:outer membrane protein OmpA-like peptidoglycan-associated protein